MLNVDYAERRHEESGEGYYTLRYLVHNGDLIGSYGVHYGTTQYEDDGFGRRYERAQDPEFGGYAYGASRDFHKLVDDAEIARIKAYEEWRDGDYEGDMPPVGWGTYLNNCMYHDNKPSVCEGSSMVEVTTDDKKAYAIAAMMAER